MEFIAQKDNNNNVTRNDTSNSVMSSPSVLKQDPFKVGTSTTTGVTVNVASPTVTSPTFLAFQTAATATNIPNTTNTAKTTTMITSDKTLNEAPTMVNDDDSLKRKSEHPNSASLPSQGPLVIPEVRKLSHDSTPPGSPNTISEKKNGASEEAKSDVKMNHSTEDCQQDQKSKKKASSTSPNPTKKPKKLNYIPSKLGRKGDPRMHKALKARLDDPKISLLDALIVGGFEFQWKNGISYDKDNVQLGQRKNQLSRRLRLHRQNHKKEAPVVNANVAAIKEERPNSGNGKGYGMENKTHGLSPGSNATKRKREVSDETISMMGNSSPQKNITSSDLTAVTSTIPNLLLNASQTGAQGFHQTQPILKQDQTQGTPGELLQYNDQHLLLSSYFSNTVGSSSALGNTGSTNTSALGVNSNSATNATNSLTKGDFYQYQDSLNVNPTTSSTTSSTFPSTTSSSQSTFANTTNERLEKLHQALNLYRFDSSALMKRCMLTAGFSHHETEECDENYLLFGEVALENEKRRLDRIRYRMNRGLIPGQTGMHCHHRQSESLLANTVPSVGCPITSTSSSYPAESSSSNQRKMNELVQNSMSGQAQQQAQAQQQQAQQQQTQVQQQQARQQQQSRGLFHMTNDDANNRKGNDMRVQNSMNGQAPPQSSSLSSTKDTNNSMYYDNSSSNSHKASSQTPQKNACNHDHHSHSHSHSSSSRSINPDHVVCNNPHLHRLEGKCGHKAVIHRPENGNAHIDFVVDGKVECYENCQPMMDSSIFWLSKFKCDKKHTPKDNQVGSNGRKHSDSDSHQHCLPNMPDVLHNPNAVPKILDVEEIDFESEEWREMRDILDNNDSNNLDPLMDEQVLGSLFKLGDSRN